MTLIGRVLFWTGWLLWTVIAWQLLGLHPRRWSWPAMGVAFGVWVVLDVVCSAGGRLGRG